MKLDFILSPELEGKFKVVGTTSPILHSRIGDVDFRIMTESQAEELIKAGTSYLQKIEPAGKKKNMV
jgi:hypothetical protein